MYARGSLDPKTVLYEHHCSRVDRRHVVLTVARHLPAGLRPTTEKSAIVNSVLDEFSAIEAFVRRDQVSAYFATAIRASPWRHL